MNTNKINKQKVAKFILSKDVATFCFFLLLAFVLWLMHGTSMRREIRKNLAVSYIGIPSDVRFTKELPDEISLILEDEGTRLWGYIRDDLDTLYVDVSDMFHKNGTIEVPTDDLITRVRARLSSTTQVVEFSPKRLVGEYENLESKLVPFELSNDILLPAYHVLTDSVRIAPKEAMIYGSKNDLKSIESVVIDVSNMEIAQSGTYEFPIVKMEYDVEIEPNIPSIKIGVEMATEKRISVPVRFVNVPEDKSVMAFPSMVRMKFSVGVSRFNSIDADDFAVEIDYEELIKNSNGIMDVKVSKKPMGICNFSVKPSEIEFIINS